MLTTEPEFEPYTRIGDETIYWFKGKDGKKIRLSIGDVIGIKGKDGTFIYGQIEGFAIESFAIDRRLKPYGITYRQMPQRKNSSDRVYLEKPVDKRYNLTYLIHTDANRRAIRKMEFKGKSPERRSIISGRVGRKYNVTGVGLKTPIPSLFKFFGGKYRNKTKKAGKSNVRRGTRKNL
jgi:hypothetical protein